MPETVACFHQRYLYPMQREYLSLIKEWRNEQMDVLRQKRHLNDKDQDAWFDYIQQDNHQVIFALCQSESNNTKRFIGYCGITNIDYENKRGEISFLVDPKRARHENLYRRDFLAALMMLCAYGFERKSLHKIFTETYAFRIFHINVLEEFGLKLGGILRDHKYFNGKYHDSVIHSLLEPEWPSVRKGVKSVLGE